MSKASLTARYRPQRFADVAGQGTVKAILSRAAAEDRIAPAYLFSGTRGVGKTTIARIFAKAINCVNAPTAEPCNECVNCRQITQGAGVDVVEIDGASNRGIEEARRLREDIGYAPMQCRYKVFIIDEAHMLTRESFNALLKTLEEPPPHATFILATTEAHKFPATIISRCQHYTFKRLPATELEEHLANILNRESVPFEPGALRLLARRAAGSVRDSMSLLGQSLALGSETLSEADVRGVLGLAGQDVFFDLMKALGNQDCVAIAGILRQVLDQGLDLGFFLRELGGVWRTLFLLKQAGESALPIIDIPADDARRWLEVAPDFSLQHIHASWQMTLEGQRRVLTSLEPALALELLLLNLAYLPTLLPLDRIGQGAQTASSSAPQAPGSGAQRRPAPAQPGRGTSRQQVPPAPPQGGYAPPQGHRPPPPPRNPGQEFGSPGSPNGPAVRTPAPNRPSASPAQTPPSAPEEPERRNEPTPYPKPAAAAPSAGAVSPSPAPVGGGVEPRGSHNSSASPERTVSSESTTVRSAKIQDANPGSASAASGPLQPPTPSPDTAKRPALSSTTAGKGVPPWEDDSAGLQAESQRVPGKTPDSKEPKETGTAEQTGISSENDVARAPESSGSFSGDDLKPRRNARMTAAPVSPEERQAAPVDSVTWHDFVDGCLKDEYGRQKTLFFKMLEGRIVGSEVHLKATHAFKQHELEGQETRDWLERVAKKLLGEGAKIVIDEPARQEKHISLLIEEAQDHPVIQTVKEELGATLITNSVRPLKGAAAPGMTGKTKE